MDDAFESWLRDRPKDAVGGLPPGTRLGAYRIVARLAVGGFAEVYRVADDQGASAAVKMLHRLDENSLARFAREARILRAARHPNFPRLLGEGVYETRPYLVLELLRPCALPSGDRAVAAFLRQILSAVAALHADGFVHRDIKPGNILERSDGTPVLIDFGLAAPISRELLEAEGLSVEDGRRVAVGTAGHSAPEQFSGRDVGPEADIHAVGMLVRDCFGERLPPGWRRIYLTATNSDPAARYPGVAEMARAIDRRLWRRLGAFLGLAAVFAVGFAAAVLMRPANTPTVYRMEHGNLDLATLNGYDFAKPVSVDLDPVGAPDPSARYTVRCTICFRDRAAPADEENPVERIDARGSVLNAWLRAYVRGSFARQPFSTLVVRYADGQLANDLSNGFINEPTYRRVLRESGLEVVAVTVQAEGAFKSELAKAVGTLLIK